MRQCNNDNKQVKTIRENEPQLHLQFWTRSVIRKMIEIKQNFIIKKKYQENITKTTILEHCAIWITKIVWILNSRSKKSHYKKISDTHFLVSLLKLEIHR